jgi:bacteriorhodopsin
MYNFSKLNLKIMRKFIQFIIALPLILVIIGVCGMYHQSPFFTYLMIGILTVCVIWIMKSESFAWEVSLMYAISVLVVFVMETVEFLDGILNNISMSHFEKNGYLILVVLLIISWIMYGSACFILKGKTS